MKRWRKGNASTDIDYLRLGQASQRTPILGTFWLGNECGKSECGAIKLIQRLDQSDKRAGLQEQQPSGVVVIGQRTKGLVAQARPLDAVATLGRRQTTEQMEPPAQRWCSIDAAHAVDRHLFDQQVIDVVVSQRFVVCNVSVLKQAHGLLHVNGQPTARIRHLSSCQDGFVRNPWGDEFDQPDPIHAAPDRHTTPLPSTFTVAFSRSARVVETGLFMGGNPIRLLRLTPRATRILGTWATGRPVGRNRAEGILARRLVSAEICQVHATTPTFSADDVTVIVPVRDRPNELRRVLASLGPLSCVVVDDGSVDPAETKAIATSAGAHCVVLPHNLGPAGARNAGLATITTPLVAFVDSDCEVEANWLDPLLGYFNDPLVGAVAPRIMSRSHCTTTSLARYESVRSSLDRGVVEGLVRPNGVISYVPTAALLVRRAAVPETAFDPALRGGEDVDFVWRLVAAGWDVRYVPRAHVHHDAMGPLVPWLARRAFYGATAGPLALRHPNNLAPVQASIWTVATWALFLARRPFLSAVTLGVSVLTLAQHLDDLVDHPLPLAWSIAGQGTLRSLRPGLSGLTRAWSPALVAGLLFPRTRRAAAAALLAPAFFDYRQASGGLDPLRYVALHVADDLAYGFGVWQGSYRARTLKPLLPRIAVRSRVWSRTALAGRLGRTAGQQSNHQ